MTVSGPDNEAIFHAARDIPDPDRRREYVREACGGDETRIAHVEALLAAADTPDSLLDRPAVGPAVDANPTGPSGLDADLPLDFLGPSETPGSLGRLGHYEVKEVIGRGGMGIVLKAFDEQLHRVVAIKVMAAPLATNATARRRFTREAQAAAAVSHDHIVTIHAVGEDRSLPYLVMQCVAGLSLQQRLDRDGPLALEEILRIGMQTASGLAAAHAQGLMHRDIKPANILLENGVERVKITDFGLARAADDASLTQSGVVAGTPQYMSPEQAEGKAIDQRTDLFGLGSVLYAMCTGRAPFRASGSMAVLKRVCEQKPTPIRESNGEIPEWLVAIIDKLHAKDPAERYQSAAEVAELLGRHLAQMQHPSIVGQVSNQSSEPKANLQPARRRRLASAAVLLCLVGGLAITEATGVTSLRATLIRIFTPDGTLVVKTDPAVKVTVEGDGGQIITGAGLEEIRLRPGNDKVHADRDGKPITPPAAPPKPDPHPFVVLADKGVRERKFDTLAEAVASTSHGDIIEIRGNGPFVSDQVRITHPLVIRAGAGYIPSITRSQASVDKEHPLLIILATLALEGLELRLMSVTKKVGSQQCCLLLAGYTASLRVANCRLIFKVDPGRGHLDSPIYAPGKYLSLRNSLLSGNGWDVNGAAWRLEQGGSCIFENNVCAVGGIEFRFSKWGPDDQDLADVNIRVGGNTLVGNCLTLRTFGKPPLPKAADASPPIHLDYSGNVARWDKNTRNKAFLFFYQTYQGYSALEAEAFLPRFIRLDEQDNVYQTGTPMLRLMPGWQLLQGKGGPGLAGWHQFWGHKKTGSIEGDIRFQGGDLVERAQLDPELITAEDFRLRSDSAGYKAGKDGKDLGADIDLVGPGPAYQRWKKTPEYQKWLKETGQKK